MGGGGGQRAWSWEPVMPGSRGAWEGAALGTLSPSAQLGGQDRGQCHHTGQSTRDRLWGEREWPEPGAEGWPGPRGPVHLRAGRLGQPPWGLGVGSALPVRLEGRGALRGAGPSYSPQPDGTGCSGEDRGGDGAWGTIHEGRRSRGWMGVAGEHKGVKAALEPGVPTGPPRPATQRSVTCPRAAGGPGGSLLPRGHAGNTWD